MPEPIYFLVANAHFTDFSRDYMTRSEFNLHPKVTSENAGRSVQAFNPCKQTCFKFFFNLPVLQIGILN